MKSVEYREEDGNDNVKCVLRRIFNDKGKKEETGWRRKQNGIEEGVICVCIYIGGTMGQEL